jgi:hypothetical protein
VVTVAPTAVPATAVPPTPTALEWFVDFYPDNRVFKIPSDQKCMALNWHTQGVTDVFLQRDGSDRQAVEPNGRQPDICFEEDEILYHLYFRIPGGEEQEKTVRVERD